MKKQEMLGYAIAFLGAAWIGPFVLLSGLRQLDSWDGLFVGCMVFGLLLSLFGLYCVARSQEE